MSPIKVVAAKSLAPILSKLHVYIRNPTISVNLTVGMFELLYHNVYKFYECWMHFFANV